MGRKRTRDFDLPPRLHRKGAAYYYVSNERPRRWIPLGTDLNRARRAWADLECSTVEHLTVGALLERYLADFSDDWGTATRRQYAAFGRTLAAEFGELPVESLSAPALAQWRDRNRHRRGWINGCMAVLRPALAKAVEWGWCPTNPARDVAYFATHERDRYLTDAEYIAIRNQGADWLADAMTLSYFTTLRESDVLALRWSAVSDVIAVRQIKTGKRQEFIVTPALRVFLDRCRARPILGLFVIATDKGRPIKQRRLQEEFARARKAAGVKDARFHDIRGKAATDAKADGQDYQALLGHSDKRQSDAYVKAKETTRVEPLRRVL
jgi:Phage integrase family